MIANNIPEGLLPQHIAMVMDGNGRWAKQRNKPRVYGHQQGVETARNMVECCGHWGIKALTLFAFSSENWKRPKKEVSFLMQLFIKALNSESKKLHKNNVCMKVIGDVSGFEEKLQQTIREAEALTVNNTGLKLFIAANYGGRWDIVETTKKIATQVKLGEIAVEQIDESIFSNNLALESATEVDLFIRSGGESRVSNFLLWQIAYAELFFTEILWPDFSAENLQEILQEYAKRERRFGRISEQLKPATQSQTKSQNEDIPLNQNPAEE